jgi:hypothetical protein
MLKLRDAIPQPQPLARAEFTTLRVRLLKIAARITETASRVRIALAACCPEAELFSSLARCYNPPAPDPRGKCPRLSPYPNHPDARQLCPKMRRRSRLG